VEDVRCHGPLRGGRPSAGTTTRRYDDATKTKIPASHFDGLLPLAAPRFARWQE